MKIRPLHDRVVLTRIDAEEKTAGGIIIPDTAKEKPQQGKVVAVGDKVVYSKYGGTEITIDGEDLLILAGRDVLAKVK